MAIDLDELLEAPVNDAGGAQVTLRSFLGAGPLVVVFLRHYG
ncbi:MAG: hypothetical protein WAT39_11815 [Planctomycetota bacterium]